MKIFVAGATGATGRLLVEELLNRDLYVTAIVRSAEKLPNTVKDHKNLTIVKASILDLSDAEMAEQIQNCDVIASCLGHNLNPKGIFGEPRKLVTDATRRLCKAAKANARETPLKFVLMNTAGNRNRNLDEPISLGEKFVMGLIRLLVPPQKDNKEVADYLRIEIGQNDDAIEWVAVRPDSLIDKNEVSKYKIHPSPIRSAIFNPGKTSRINVGYFMANLITDNELWKQWKGQMPVIYNEE